MSTKDYAILLRGVLKMQIDFIKEESDWEENEFYEGQIRGLEIAMDKIDASKFLYERGEQS